jgi:uncharacterized protein YajQ (UPF0234 family)
MPTFDVVCEPNMVELKNAIEQANKEISTRFDFKGSDSRVELKEELLILFADDDFKLGQVRDVLINKMAKRNVDVRYLKDDKLETIGGDKRKQSMKIQKGVTSDLSKKIVRIIKDSKIKVQASIQGTRYALPVVSGMICKRSWPCCAKMSAKHHWVLITSGTKSPSA